MSTRKNVISAAILALVVAGGVVGYRMLDNAGPEAEAPAEPAKKGEPGVIRYEKGAPQLASLRVARVEEMAMPVAEPSNGRITYDENLTARVSSPIAGRVTALRAEVGDPVARNAVLLDIDSPDFASADADYQKARADEQRKKLAFDRAKGLLEHEVIARKEYEVAAADYQQAVAESRRASLRLRNLNVAGTSDSGRFQLRAPIAGVVADKQVNPGMEVRPDLQNPLFVITDVTKLWAIIDLPERSIANVRPGQAVSIETDAYPNERFGGRVERVGLALDPTTRRVQVRCMVLNPDKRLKPEMFARVAFIADGEKKAIRVPNSSLIVEGIYNHVFVERKPGEFEKRRVRIALRGTEASFIDAGLAAGDRIVTEGALLLNAEVGSDAK
ncbi:membrane fusion protein, cobalt-zinc-cadmium efflux system [Noviherbaspirillum humi]|uniref:Membrane fusion protein, cobalt-zinc-cadmium efflux system n=1 Tax=Noviherbaspirillum humi TaxID=1688639 RepID=A0A239JMP2_9BURK|nr:efflux RND transporter periplasmic adaptor subunit [Noviherbaspirillum humi]SNT07161.1 membrane fusion protein, cobalt-zinc-cadmium efflux system [Noviherbaspirillum humi]